MKKAAMLFLLTIPALLLLNDAFTLAARGIPLGVLLIAGVGAALAICLIPPALRGRWRQLVPGLAALLFLGFSFLYRQALAAGTAVFLNGVTAAWTDATARIYPAFQEEAGSRGIFAAFLAITLTLFLRVLVNRPGRWGTAVLALVALAGAAGGFMKITMPFALFLLAVLAVFVWQTADPELAAKSGKEAIRVRAFGGPLPFLRGAALLLLGMLLLAGILRGGEEQTPASRTWLGQAWHEFRYEEAENPLPEGNLAHAGAFQPGKGIALTVEMDEPQGLYLKGYVGERFNGTGFRDLKGTDLAAWRSAFYQLHAEGFYGQSIPAQAALAGTGVTTSPLEEDRTTSLNIRVEGACRAYLYLPYALAPGTEPLCDPRGIGDAAVLASYSAAVGEDHAYACRLLREVPSGAVGASAAEAAQRFAALESIYREFVYTHYLKLAPEDARIVEAFFGEPGEVTGKGPAETAAKIVEKLRNGISFDEEAVLDGADWLETFLLKEQRGWACHYAGAAVLMLRACGIPARYVEGYVLTEDLAARGGTIAVPLANAHAWAEYYVDGSGWTQLEVTEKYRGEVPYVAQPEQVAGHADPGQEAGAQMGIEADATPGRTHRFGKALFLLLLVFGIIGLLCALRAVLPKRRRLQRLLAKIQKGSPREAVLYGFPYLNRLLALNIPGAERMDADEVGQAVGLAYGPQQEEIYRQLAACYEGAAYGRRDVAAEDAEQIRIYLAEVKKKVTAERGWRARLSDRFGDALY